MNYLAHIFLSGDDSQLQIGNFIGDFVKGSRVDDYPERIRNGIILHRKIDSFTDSHEVVREMIVTLRPTFGRYSGIIADMYFDFFLAISFSRYSSSKSLNTFALKFYLSTLLHYKMLPAKVKGFIFHFIFSNRLKKYASLKGLKSSLEIMAEYKVSAINPKRTIAFLVENQDDLEERFHLFFPDLIEYVKSETI